MAYEPLEDSYLLAETLKKYSKDKNRAIRILDMGAGSGIQAGTCRKLGFKNILTSDIDKESIKLLKEKGFKAIKSNLFENIKDKYDLIIFNPPYLPENKYDKEKDTTGGKEGCETILKFLKQAKSNLNKNGKILLLFSSLSSLEIIKKEAEDLGYKIKKLSNKKLFFEELYVYELKLK